MFEKLLDRKIDFTIPGGNQRTVCCGMLSVRFYPLFAAIVKDTEKEPVPEKIAEARAALRALALKVWPESEKEALFHFDYAGMCALVTALFFGEKSFDSPKRDERGENRKSSVDPDLAAARIMHIFPAFSFDRLLDLTFEQFFAWSELAVKIQAETALNTMIPAIVAGMGDNETLEALRKITERAGRGNAGESDAASYTKAELDEALERAANADKLKNQKTFGTGSIIEA